MDFDGEDVAFCSVPGEDGDGVERGKGVVGTIGGGHVGGGSGVVGTIRGRVAVGSTGGGSLSRGDTVGI